MKQKIKVQLDPRRIEVGRYGEDMFDGEKYAALNGALWVTVDGWNVAMPDGMEHEIAYDPKTGKLSVSREIEVEV